MVKCHLKLAEIKKFIDEIDCLKAKDIQENGAVILDVRTIAEYNLGHIENSIYIGRDFLEMKIEQLIPNDKTKIITVCQGGVRSLFAAESLSKLGYENVASLAGGIKAWAQSLPLQQAE